MAFVSNPWVIGIITGLVVWFITFAASRLLLSKRENREYAQKVASANREVIVAIRPGIAEGAVPPSAVFEAIIHSTARRYGVTPADMYNQRQISEELIKEVMDSSFLSSGQKTEYCGKLVPVGSESRVVTPERLAEDLEKSAAAARYRDRMATMMSLILSVSAGIMTLLLSLPKLGKEPGGLVELHSWTILVPAAVTLLAVVFVFVFRDLRGRLKSAEHRVELGELATQRFIEGLKLKIQQAKQGK